MSELHVHGPIGNDDNESELSGRAPVAALFIVIVAAVVIAFVGWLLAEGLLLALDAWLAVGRL